MKFNAFGNHLIVKIIELGNVTKSGIITGNNFGKGMVTAVEVESVGADVTGVSVGDKLLVTKSSMISVDYMNSDNEYAIIEPKAIMANIVED